MTIRRRVGFDLGIATSGACVINPDGSVEVSVLEQPKSKGVPIMIDWANRIAESAKWATQFIREGDLVAVEMMSFARGSNAVISTAGSFSIFSTIAIIRGCEFSTIGPKEWRAFVTGRAKPTDTQVYNAVSFMFGDSLRDVKPKMYTHAADACGVAWWSTTKRNEGENAAGKGNRFFG